MGKWTTHLMKVYLGKLRVSSNLIQCKSAIHVTCLSYLETCARPPVTPDRAFNDNIPGEMVAELQLIKDSS